MVETKQFGGWEQIKPLGEGGQSRVSLVRNPPRVQARKNAVKDALAANPWNPYARLNAALEREGPEHFDRLAKSLWEYMRPDDPSELGALKEYKIPTTGPEATEAAGRLKNEIEMLRRNEPGLLKLLDANEHEKWIVTEFVPGGTIEKNPHAFQGNAFAALKAFRSVVETAAALHHENIVHRDIKPANVFIGENGQLVLGDLGIVYLPNQAERLTTSNEKVGPQGYMPVWGNMGVWLENVQPNFDVYMLGKLLWCMIDGHLKLPREYHRKPYFDLEKTFPNNRHMKIINSILDKCLVEEHDKCLPSAKELLEIVDGTLDLFERELPMLDQTGTLHCHICGRGTYQTASKEFVRLQFFDEYRRLTNEVDVQVFICSICQHWAIFTPRYPEHIINRGWKP